MKASELRIGNLLRNNLNGNILIPCDILCDGINTDRHEGLNYCFIDPIPLTKEWLLKFGFEKRGVNRTRWVFWKIDLVEDEKGIYSFDESRIYIDIKYVHQLQNLYFALTNEELTLKQN